MKPASRPRPRRDLRPSPPPQPQKHRIARRRAELCAVGVPTHRVPRVPRPVLPGRALFEPPGAACATAGLARPCVFRPSRCHPERSRGVSPLSWPFVPHSAFRIRTGLAVVSVTLSAAERVLLFAVYPPTFLHVSPLTRMASGITVYAAVGRGMPRQSCCPARSRRAKGDKVYVTRNSRPPPELRGTPQQFCCCSIRDMPLVCGRRDCA